MLGLYCNSWIQVAIFFHKSILCWSALFVFRAPIGSWKYYLNLLRSLFCLSPNQLTISQTQFYYFVQESHVSQLLLLFLKLSETVKFFHSQAIVFFQLNGS